MIKSLESKNGVAKHLQLRNILLKLIGTEYDKRQVFHSERELMQMFDVSSLTVSRAMKSLVADGIVERKVGAGTFVKKGGDDVLMMLEKPEPFILYVNISQRHKLAEIDPLNWFVTGETQRGIINTFSGRMKMLNTRDISAQLGREHKSGCILINPQPKEEENLRKLNDKLVSIDLDSRLKPAPNCIKWECASGIYQLLSYFVQDCGHRKIALIAGSSDPHKSRIAAFRINCETFEVSCPPEYIKLVDTGTQEAGREAMRELLALGPNRPTAVFVDTDIKAEGAIQAVTDAGLRVPEDISIAGFDDIPDAKYMQPPLTTVKVPYYEMGKEAVKRLVTGNKRAACVPMQTELIVRESTGKVPNKRNIEI